MSAEQLRNEQCRALAGAAHRLEGEALAGLLAAVPQWRLLDDGKAIGRELRFDGFCRAGLHQCPGSGRPSRTTTIPIPSWAGLLRIRFSTHDVGGLSRNDFISAAKVDALLTPAEPAPPRPSRNHGRWLAALWLIAVALTVYFIIAHWHTALALRPAPDLLSTYMPERALWLEERGRWNMALAAACSTSAMVGALVVPDAVWVLTLILYLIPIIYVLRRGFFRAMSHPPDPGADPGRAAAGGDPGGAERDPRQCRPGLHHRADLRRDHRPARRQGAALFPGNLAAWRNAAVFTAIVVAILVTYRVLVQPDYAALADTEKRRYAAWAVFQQWLLNACWRREALPA